MAALDRDSKKSLFGCGSGVCSKTSAKAVEKPTRGQKRATKTKAEQAEAAETQALRALERAAKLKESTGDSGKKSKNSQKSSSGGGGLVAALHNLVLGGQKR